MAKVPRDSVSHHTDINKKKTYINPNQIISTPNLAEVHQVLSEMKRTDEQSAFH
jgi:hypothetical protein